MNYTKEQKDEIVQTYFTLKRTEVPVSIRSYAAHVGIKYYTFRDWYRDYKASAEYRDISTNEYSMKRKAGAVKPCKLTSDDGFSFIKITDDDNQNQGIPEEEGYKHVFDR